jgi:hypothetical protein
MVRPTPPEFHAANNAGGHDGFNPAADHFVDYAAHGEPPPPMMGLASNEVERWVNEQMFEEDVRSVLKMMRPNRREKLQGWNEYRTGGSHYRITVSWDDEFQITDPEAGKAAVPHLADVIETLLVGSAKTADEAASAADEFDGYRQVVRDVYQRLQQRQACYE